MMEKNKTCCFTGHRSIPATQLSRVLQNAETAIKELYDQGYRYFEVGGAVGFDTEMAKLLFRLRDHELSGIKVILAYPFVGFTDRWDPMQKQEFQDLFREYDETVCVSSIPGRNAYRARNRHLVNESSICVAYCTDINSGTGYTVRYAREHHVRVINLAEI